jgi:hypothetical protein
MRSKEAIRKYQKQYRLINAKRLKLHGLKYRKARREYLRLKAEKYRRDNAEAIRQRRIDNPPDKTARRARQRLAYWANPEKKLARDRRYRRKNRAQILARSRLRYANNVNGKRDKARRWHWENREKNVLRSRQYSVTNKERIARRRRKFYCANRERMIRISTERARKRRLRDPLFRLVHSLRGRLSKALKSQKAYKHSKTLQLLGCTIPQLREHLEKQWSPGMSWKNYKYRGWHVDHIRPCASFDLADPAQQKKCFHYTNIQPLWRKKNMLKSDFWKDISSRKLKT